MSTYMQKYQIRKANTFDDTLNNTAIAGIESSAVDDEDFQEGILSRLRQLLQGDTGNWHDAVEGTATDPRSLKTLTDDIYYKKELRFRTVLTDVTVGGSDDYVVLSVSGSEAPNTTAAVGAVSTLGAVVAQAGTFGQNDLAEVAGLNSIRPKNLCLVRDSSSHEKLLSSGREIFALIQSEIATDGHTFDDTTQQVQLSFVRENSTGDDLEACPAADIQGKTINYQWPRRIDFKDINEQDGLGWDFGDPTAGGGTTSLNQAYQAGSTITVQTAEGDLIFNLSEDTTQFEVQRNGSSFFTLLRNDTTGDKLTLDADDLDVNLTNPADFDKGVKVATGTQTINVGNTAVGQIDSTAIKLAATTGDATIQAAVDVEFTDARDTALPLTDATAGSIAGLPGGPYASISAAIRAALTAADLDVFVQTLGSAYAQDANIPGSGNWSPALDLSARTLDMNSGAIANVDTMLFLNGRLLHGGNGTTNNDVYIGDTPANGDLKVDFPKGVKAGDVFIAVSWKSS